MPIKLFHLLFVVVLLINCNEISNIIQPNNEQQFPLKIGYYWEYSATGSEKWEVVSDSSINGKEYYVIQTTLFHEPIIARLDEQGNVRRYIAGLDTIWFDFLKIDNEIYYSYNCPVTVRKNITVKTSNQTFNSCTDFFFNVPQIADEEIGYTVAPGYGIVRIHGAWGLDMYLTNARIN